jgi:hypothetical protein
MTRMIKNSRITRGALGTALTDTPTVVTMHALTSIPSTLPSTRRALETRRSGSRGRRNPAGRDPATLVAASSKKKCNNDDERPASMGRRESLTLASLAALAASKPRDAHAAYGGATLGDVDAGPARASTELSLYKRSFRERFETSISSGTHDYSFKYPKETWKPDIVSLNDGKLYGVDLRFSSPVEGKMCTHVLPFVDKDSLKEVGTPAVALDRFVELIGAFWDDNGFGVPGGNAGSVKNTTVVTKDGVVYYQYELDKPRNLISAAVTDGQLYVINASAGNERQWAAGEANLRNIVESFYVPP